MFSQARSVTCPAWSALCFLMVSILWMCMSSCLLLRADIDLFIHQPLDGLGPGGWLIWPILLGGGGGGFPGGLFPSPCLESVEFPLPLFHILLRQGLVRQNHQLSHSPEEICYQRLSLKWTPGSPTLVPLRCKPTAPCFPPWSNWAILCCFNSWNFSLLQS